MVKNINRKEKTSVMSFKTVNVKLPINLYEELKQISDLTGISMNAICNELLRPAIKNKLKEVK